jgi:DeoR/GlpR family transcriptional regulator of sugar metabolism
MAKKRTSTRLEQILDLLSSQREVTVAELTEWFQVTRMTIRRDMNELEKQGRITRTHGGAILAAPAVASFAFLDRHQTHMPEKLAIAEAAAKLVKPGMTVILDTGTTTLEVAKCLAGISGLRVLTSSLAVASTLFANENLELTLLGGTVSTGSPDLSGMLTEENLKGFRADLAFLGADGVDEDGLYTEFQSIARVSQAIIASAQKAILVASRNKFGKTSFVRFAKWKDVDSVIVGGRLTAAQRRWLKKGVKDVIEAPV